MDTRETICSAGARLYERGLSFAHDGNISVRTADSIIITPSGCSKRALAPEDIIETDLSGRITRPRSDGRVPSSEIAIHLALYAARSDVTAAIHAHPPMATAYACTGRHLEIDLLAEAAMNLGLRVPLVPYASPGTQLLADGMRPYFNGRALLMANHGVFTWGRTMEEALCRMESLENYVGVLFRLASAKLSPTPIDRDELNRLAALLP